MNDQRLIDHFLARCQARLQRNWQVRVAAWTLLLAGLLMIAVALGFIATGRSVPGQAYAWCFGLVSVGGLVALMLRNTAHSVAARIADRRFHLRDALISYLGFQGRDASMEVLQARHTAAQIDACDPAQLRQLPSNRWWFGGCASLLIAGMLGLVDESAARQQDREDKALLQQKTASVIEHLQTVQQDLDRAAPEMAQVHDDLTSLIADLEASTDKADALRHFAAMEQKLRQQIKKLSAKQQQELLQQAGKEMQEQPETKKLGEQLARKQFKDAAETLQQLQPDPADDLKKQQQKLQRLKAAAQQLAQATRAKQQRRSAGGGQGGQAGGVGGAHGAGGVAAGADLEDMLLNLEQAALEAQKQLDLALKDLKDLQKIDPKKLQKCQDCNGRLGQCVGGLCDKLGQLGDQILLAKELEGLRRGLGQYQGFLNAEEKTSLLAQLASPAAGLNAGTQDGEPTAATALDQFAGGVDRLQGKKGAGPRQMFTEAAESGQAISRQTSESRQREYARQLESFINRDDIPEDLKSGVKEYFTTIHQQTPASAPAYPPESHDASFVP